MKIEKYILRFLILVGLAAASITTIAEVLSYRTINLSIMVNFGAIAGLLVALLIMWYGKYNMAGVLATLTLAVMMLIEIFASEFPRQGSIAVFLVIALANSIIFKEKLRVVMHLVCFMLLGFSLIYLYNAGYRLPDESSYISMVVNLLVIYCLIGFSSYAMKRRYDQVIDQLNSFNDHLEEQVETRTKQLIDYSFKNSHEVRAPLTRILSLVELYRNDKQIRNDEETISILSKSATELDDILKEVNLILNKEKED